MNIDTLVIANLSALGLFLLKEFFNFIKGKEKEIAKALNENTFAIQKLTIQLEIMEKKLDEKTQQIPELKRDIDGLGKKVRSMASKIEQ
jgi:CII-binding regulator of phage lambda lysogenization HflD